NQTSTNGYNDQTGRLNSTTTFSHTNGYGYDRAGKITTQTVDGSVIATAVYTPQVTGGELDTVTYPTGAGNAGNGTKLNSVTRDSAGNTTLLDWRKADNTLITSDSYTRSQAARVIDEKIDGTDPFPTGNNYSYDTAGQLSTARTTGHAYAYTYAPTAGCGANTLAGVNGNRTSYTDNTVTIATYCYDNSDRLTSTTHPGYTGTITYDTRGNTTAIAGQTLTYDQADRHMATYVPNQTSPTTSVVYQRDVTDTIVSRTATVGTPGGAAPVSRAASSAATSSGGGATTLAVNRP